MAGHFKLMSKKIEITELQEAKIYDRKNQGQLNALKFYVTLDRLRFTHNTSARLGMKPGLRVVFVELGDWYVCVCDTTTGYLLNRDSKRAGISICARVIARAILKQIAPGKDRCECVVTETQYVYHGKPLYKIENRLIGK